MYLSKLTIQNFRQFDDSGVTLELQPGITVLAGPNDSGKTAVVDAIRYVLTTKDQEHVGVQADDYHIRSDGTSAPEIVITCEFDDLSDSDKANFLEYLTADKSGLLRLIVQWRAVPKSVGGRRWSQTTVTAGSSGDGPSLDTVARHLLASAYLRPLRDAEREMSSGKGSRLSKVLNSFPGIDAGASFNPATLPQDSDEVEGLSIAGMHEYLRHIVNRHSGVKTATAALNDDYLSNISLAGDNLVAEINFVNGANDADRLRRILERLELNFLDQSAKTAVGRYGLGSNNLLYMACELLLVAKEGGLPLLLVEEPEAHLHPQRQLQLMQFLADKVGPRYSMQVIISTHSPILASKAKVQNLVLLHEGHAFSLAEGKTELSRSDYGFLERFLDATKSNLFFAQAVIVVEGDAEELLLPTIARLVDRDLTKSGVSIVNVGSTALRRYTRIFQRTSVAEDEVVSPALNIPVASICDRDVMPSIAPKILELVQDQSDEKWKSKKRKWRTEDDPLFITSQDEDHGEQISVAKQQIMAKLIADDGQSVKSFPADNWTLEYDLARSGLSRQMFLAATLAKQDESIRLSGDPDEKLEQSLELAEQEYISQFAEMGEEERAVNIYKMFHSGAASKAIAAQYLSQILEREFGNSAADLWKLLPTYLKEALKYVTFQSESV